MVLEINTMGWLGISTNGRICDTTMKFVFYKTRVTYLQAHKVFATPEIFCSTFSLYYITA